MALPNAFPGFSQPKYLNHTKIQNGNTALPFQPKKLPKAGANGVLVEFVLDESGSMQSCFHATVTGFNQYLQSQKNADGKCLFSLTKFSGGNTKPVWDNVDIHKIKTFDQTHYCPDGGTNLLDAVGVAFEKIANTLSKMNKTDRPAVIVTIMTDGEENMSKTYNHHHIKYLMELAQKANWTVTYLGANQDAWQVASSMGIAQTHAMNYSTANMSNTMQALSKSTAIYRSALAAGLSTAELNSMDYFAAVRNNVEKRNV